MPYLKQVTINGLQYYYLFHTVRDGSKFRKLSKYLGKEKPSDVDVEKLKAAFLVDIKAAKTEAPEEHVKQNVIIILQDLQEKFGYLPKDEIIKVSKELEIPAVDLFGVATFYSQFKLKQQGKHIISVCRGTACHVKNSESILEKLSTMLDVQAGQTTKDGRFTLDVVNCIGACAKAPAIMIDKTVFGELTEQKLQAILDQFK